MSLRNKIDEDEFDRLPNGTQKHYIYCPLCGCYYLTSIFFHHKCKP